MIYFQYSICLFFIFHLHPDVLFSHLILITSDSILYLQLC